MNTWEDWHILRCAIHLHTTFSDGDMGIEEVIACAAETGVDALLVTDHGQSSENERLWEGVQQGVAVFMGRELESKSGDHFLVFGIREKVAVGRHSSPDAVHLLDSLGALAIVAHPQGRPRYYMFKRKYPWTHWGVREYYGIEVWSYMHDWIENITPAKLAAMCIEPHTYIDGPDPQVLAQWDMVAETRRIAGIGGLDAHGRKLPLGLDKWFPWAKEGILPIRQNFADFAHYLLTRPLCGEIHEDASRLQRAIKDCQGWMIHDRLQSGKDFLYYGTLDGKPFPVGTELILGEQIRLHVESPVSGEIRLLCRGQVVAKEVGTALEFLVEAAGEYRVEVRLDGRFWALTNHIYIRRPDFHLTGGRGQH